MPFFRAAAALVLAPALLAPTVLPGSAAGADTRANPVTRLVTHTETKYGDSYGVSLSGDGNHVSFTSFADDVTVGDDNSLPDVFVHHRRSGKTFLVSGNPGNAASGASSLSATGRYLAFVSGASGLVPGDTGDIDVFRRDLRTGNTVLVSGAVTNPDGWYRVQVLDDGSVVFGSYTDIADTVYRWDATTGVASPVLPPSPGARYIGTSRDGRYDAWRTGTQTLAVLDHTTGAETARCSGDLFAAVSFAAGTVARDGTLVVGRAVGPAPGGGDAPDRLGLYCDTLRNVVKLTPSTFWVVSPDGRSMVVARGVTVAGERYLNLVVRTDDGNAKLWRRLPSDPVRNTEADMAISDDGDTVVYASNARNLVRADPRRDLDVYLWKRPTG